MVHWTGKGKRQRLPGEQQRRARLDEVATWRRESLLTAIKAKLDLYGEESLDREEREIVRLFPDFFYPEEG